MFQVTKIGDLLIIIDHFNLYPLKTQKFADFLLFKKTFDIINDKKHLTIEGLHELISIRASLIKGLAERLKVAFPNIKPIVRPEVPNLYIKSNNSNINYWFLFILIIIKIKIRIRRQVLYQEKVVFLFILVNLKHIN
jgi:LAGLIDADG endonuclease